VSTKIFPVSQSTERAPKSLYEFVFDPRTRVDELLLSRIPSLLRSNLIFHLRDLFHEQKSAVGGLVGEQWSYRLRWLGLDCKLLLL
jgi:hypothetical protein